MNATNETFFLIGPGRLFGDIPRKWDMRETRHCIMHALQQHHGHAIWVDDDQSYRIEDDFEKDILKELQRLHDAGFVARRVWGCINESFPYAEWMPYGPEGVRHVFCDDIEAVRYFGNLPSDDDVTLTGAWLGLTDRVQNLNRAQSVLRDEFGCQNFEIGRAALVDLDHEYWLIAG